MNLTQRLFTRFCFATAALVLPTVADNARADDMGVVGDSYGVGTPTTSGLAGASALASPDLSTGQVRATYSFHLNTARGASQPALQLSYRSDGPIAEAGRGWTLGMGGVERRGSPWPNYQNPAPGTALDATFSDRFFFADEPLVPICTVGLSTCPEGESMPKWAVGWHYFRLQREGMFARFFWSSDPKTWRIQMKNGETIELDGLKIDPRFPIALRRSPARC